MNINHGFILQFKTNNSKNKKRILRNHVIAILFLMQKRIIFNYKTNKDNFKFM